MCAHWDQTHQTMVDTSSKFIALTPCCHEALASHLGIIVCKTLLIFHAPMDDLKSQRAVDCRESFTSCELCLLAVISSHSRLIWSAWTHGANLAVTTAPGMPSVTSLLLQHSLLHS